MPQMAPLSWTLLMAAFVTLYFFTSAKMFFTNKYLGPLSKFNENKTQKNFQWKW